jgi:hypothetical protein
MLEKIEPRQTVKRIKVCIFVPELQMIAQVTLTNNRVACSVKIVTKEENFVEIRYTNQKFN